LEARNRHYDSHKSQLGVDARGAGALHRGSARCAPRGVARELHLALDPEVLERLSARPSFREADHFPQEE